MDHNCRQHENFEKIFYSQGGIDANITAIQKDIDGIGNRMTAMEECIAKIKKDTTTMKVKYSIWGAIFYIVGGGVLKLVFTYLGKAMI